MGVFGDIFGGADHSQLCPVGVVGGEAVTVKFTKLAIKMIDKYITSPNAVFVRTSENPISDPNRPFEVARPTTTDYNVKILFTRDDLEDRQLQKYRKNSTLVEGQVNGYMYPYEGFEPSLKDTVVWNGKPLNINAIDPIQPIDEVILYFFEFGT